jgi:hypothetical protein
MRAVVWGLKKYGTEHQKETLWQVRRERSLDPHLPGNEGRICGQTQEAILIPQ